MTVLGAPEELEALVGLFGKLYVHTFDCATFYAKRAKHEKKSDENVHGTPPLETRARITVFILRQQDFADSEGRGVAVIALSACS